MSPDTLFTIDAKYCIDTNVIVSFMYLHDDEPYRRDAFPEQWEAVERLITEGAVVAPRRVEVELQKWEKRIPDMRSWLTKHSHMFRDLSTKQLAAAKEIVNQFPAYGKDMNAIADLEVITLAAASTLTVVTNEKAGTQVSNSKPKIPNICKFNAVRCLSVPGFLKEARGM